MADREAEIAHVAVPLLTGKRAKCEAKCQREERNEKRTSFADYVRRRAGVGTRRPAIAPAAAEDSIYVPLFTYRTGPFARLGQPIADGMHDYLTMLNERDGGIGGVKLNVEECETGYDTQKGLECYEAVKPKNPVMVNPWSTGITLSLIPRAAVDKIPILSMAYGLSASADGNVFPWVFNPPDTYWDGLSEIIDYIGEGVIDKLKGKKIGYIYLDAGFGKEPMPLFSQLAQGLRLRDQALSGAAGRACRTSRRNGSTCAATSPIYHHVRLGRDERHRDQGGDQGRLSHGQVHLHLVAGRFRRSVGRRGRQGLQDAQLARRQRRLSRLAGHQEARRRTGKSQSAKDKFGNVLYNRGVYNSVLIAEAIPNAQKLTGKKIVTGEDVRRGLETIDLDAARFKAMGMEGFAAPFKLTCADHNGHSATFIQQWDGSQMGEGHRPDRS